MNNYELLDMIGDANEDYVRAADSSTAQPRSRWKAWAACAACAALVAAVYPISQAFRTDTPQQNTMTPLHDYIVVEGGALAACGGDAGKRFADGIDSDLEAAAAEDDYVSAPAGESGSGVGGAYYEASGQDVPAQGKAIAQYDRLMQSLGVGTAEQQLLLEASAAGEPAEYPEWFAGAWIDNSCRPEAQLAVAVVNGFRTPELEAQIVEWTGGETVMFQDAKYSMSHLDRLMQPVGAILDGLAVSCGFGVSVMENCLTVDIYSDKGIPDHILASLARLDPDGDAIRVQIFAGTLSTYDETAMKGPAPDAVSTPVSEGEREFPAEEPMPAQTENGQPAQYDTLPGKAEDLPQAKYDVIYGDD